MNLAVCIFHSKSGYCDLEKTKESLKTLSCSYTIYLFDTLEEIKEFTINAKEDWILILNDREYLDHKLSEIFNVLFSQDDVGAFSFYCTQLVGTDIIFFLAIRLVRSGVKFKNLTLALDDKNIQIVKILDGWVFEHGIDSYTVHRYLKHHQQSIENNEGGSSTIRKAS